jgi:hypothetical protein
MQDGDTSARDLRWRTNGDMTVAITPVSFMPLGATKSLDAIYARQRLLQEEAARLEQERDLLGTQGPDADRRYILDIESRALQEEAAKLGSSISDILDRDLQR